MLAHRLSASGPEQFEALGRELQSLRRSASEAELLREQLGQQRRLWQEAEQRAADLQVRGGVNAQV